MASGDILKKQKNILLIILISIIFVGIVFGQSEIEKKVELTGSLYADSKIIMNDYSQLSGNPMADDMPSKKSPVLAGVLSAVIPGAGQIYNEDYWIAAAFVVVEAALVTTAVVYDNKGDDQTTYFQNYADDYTNPDHHWSVVDYAQWLIDYHDGDPSIIINTDETIPPWQRVDWVKLNAAEVGSHHLPPHGDQQYYEQIGKYHQYSPGWNDFSGGSNKEIISPNFLYYSDQRGQANDYYNTASTAIVGIYINHLLAAGEAIWGANRFNDKLTVNIRVEPYNFASGTELVPTLKMKFSF
jgi:Family of unknown function (DUF5683)